MDYSEQHPLFTHKELRHVLHVRANKTNPDSHIIRETLHFSDGHKKNQVRVEKDFKRPVYITLPGRRNYKQHKEREHKSNLDCRYTTESNLSSAIARALGNHTLYGSVRQMCNSPYVFGAASSSVVLIRRAYKQKWNVPPTPQRYLAYDLETCVFDEGGSIIIAALAIDEIVEVYIRRDFLTGIDNPIEKLQKLQPWLFETYGYSDVMKGCEVHYELVDTEMGIVKILAERMHLHDPDVVAAWNHDFDVNKIIKRCEAHNINVADIFSHSCVPPNVRRFEFLEGKRNKLTANGTFRPLQASEQWHNVRATTGFVWLDAMCVYRRLRSQSQFLSSYGLDNIASIHTGVGKLHTSETEHMSSLERHQYMQVKDKLTYCIYAALDPRLMILIERAVKDITLRLPIELSGSDYFDTASSSKRTVDMFAEELEKDNYVLGTVGEEPDEFDEEVLPLSGWPLTLPNDMHHMEGIKCLSDYPDLATNIYPLVEVKDLTSAYPTSITALNTSKETTKHEYIRLEGAHTSPDNVLKQNMNIFNGAVNALDYCIHVYGFSPLEEVDKIIQSL